MSQPIALVVEDDRFLLEVFSKAVARAGYAVEGVTDGEAARVRLQTLQPDIVVLDLRLPEVPGADLLTQIRSDARLAHTRVIIATSDVYQGHMLRPLADVVLIKPVGYAQLRELAGQMLTPVAV